MNKRQESCVFDLLVTVTPGSPTPKLFTHPLREGRSPSDGAGEKEFIKSGTNQNAAPSYIGSAGVIPFDEAPKRVSDREDER